MEKLLTLVLCTFIFVAPLTTHAAIDSLNGLTDAVQKLVTPMSEQTNSMHMEIIQVGTDRNRFRWDGTPWRIDQGGTGLQSIPLLGQLLVGDGSGGYDLVATSSLGIQTVPGGEDGQIQFNSNGVLSGSDSLLWNNAVKGLEIVKDNQGGPFLQSSVYGNTFLIPILQMQKAAGTHADPERATGGLLGRINWQGYNGSDFETVASILAPIDKSWTSADPNARLSFETSDDGFGGLETRMVISSNGNIGIGGTTTPSALLTVSKGASATTTVNFGEIGDNTSRTCFNTKNTDGDDISFYFVGTTMVVENNPCQ